MSADTSRDGSIAMGLSVVIPTHNPRSDYLALVLGALRRQAHPGCDWELVVVDNASDPPLAARLDFSRDARATVCREQALGLVRARLAGIAQARGEVLVFVDDDNVLAPDFLAEAWRIAQTHHGLGAWGGRIVPRYEAPVLAPPESVHALLTLRDAKRDLWSNDIGHHASTPWGAGLCVRRAVALDYAAEVRQSPGRLALDLHGQRLLYGGDTDIVYTACRMGLAKGVFSSLTVEHLIPVSRCAPEYLCRVAEGRGYSEVLHEFLLTGRLPAAASTYAGALRRFYRRLRVTALERKVMRAHERGRRRALTELAAARSP